MIMLDTAYGKHLNVLFLKLGLLDKLTNEAGTESLSYVTNLNRTKQLSKLNTATILKHFFFSNTDLQKCMMMRIKLYILNFKKCVKPCRTVNFI